LEDRKRLNASSADDVYQFIKVCFAIDYQRWERHHEPLSKAICSVVGLIFGLSPAGLRRVDYPLNR
jgi:hypothetical protein